MYLIVDTETNGLGSRTGSSPRRRTPPRMLELAYLLVSGDGRADRVSSSLIVPDGFGIPRQVQALHGITPQLAAESGVGVEEALVGLFSAAREATVIVAHNALFDMGVIAAEADRAGLPVEAIASPWYCTMRGGARLCRNRGVQGPAWPTLERLHTALFGEGFSGGHRALADAEACARCFLEMRRLRQLDRCGLLWCHRSTLTSRRR